MEGGCSRGGGEGCGDYVVDDMTSIETVRNAIEVTIPRGAKVVYLSHPVTTGGRPMAEKG